MHLGTEQHMLLAPRMLMAIEVLQLPSGELEPWLAEQAASNEALAVEPVPAERRGTRADTDAWDEMLRNQPNPAPGLPEAVGEQLAHLDLEPGLRAWVDFLVACLDPRGFLSPSDEELLALARERGLDGGPAELGRALATLQSLEPPGIGARNAVEALLLQLDPRDEDYPSLCRLLEEFLDELAKNRMPAVARAMGLDLAELERLLGVLRHLDPRPAASLVEVAAPIVVPDLVVEEGEAGFEVALTRGVLPAVSVDAEVRALASSPDTARDVRGYLRGKIDQARWIVDAVTHRGETLLRVGRAALARQRRFLERGPGHLVPLTMGEIAAELDLHVSTVSRAVSGKHVQTPWGIVPLRTLFQSAAGGEGDAVARDELRETVRGIFEAEDPTRPLSDEEVVTELAGRGVRVARRTVAKYRKELGIPSSYRRRRFT